LDYQLKGRVANLARLKKKSTSEVLREAVASWVEEQEHKQTAYDLISDLIGTGQGGDPLRSTRKVSEVLKARRK
jgi:hypothetical protein